MGSIGFGSALSIAGPMFMPEYAQFGKSPFGVWVLATNISFWGLGFQHPFWFWVLNQHVLSGLGFATARAKRRLWGLRLQPTMFSGFACFE